MLFNINDSAVKYPVMCNCDLTIVDTDLARASACYTKKVFPLCVTQILFKPDFKCNIWMKIIVLMHKINT